MLKFYILIFTLAVAPRLVWAKFEVGTPPAGVTVDDCRLDLAPLGPRARAAVTALLVRDQLLEMQKTNPRFERDLSPEALVAHLVLFAEGWRMGAQVDTDQTTAREILQFFKKPEPNPKLFADVFARTTWLRKNFFYHKANMIEVLGRELVRREIPWNERAALFRRYIHDPRLDKNKFISLYALDPLLGIDALEAARQERKNFGPGEMEDRADGQRKWLGAAAYILWSNYGWLAQLMKPEYFKPGQRLVDIGSGIGRVAAFTAAMYPDLEFTGVEIEPGRLELARAWAERFQLGSKIRFERKNLLVDEVPLGDHYYFFNSLSEIPYAKLLNTLRVYSHRRPFQMYVSYDPNGEIEKKYFLLEIFSADAHAFRISQDPSNRAVSGAEISWPMRVYRTAGRRR